MCNCLSNLTAPATQTIKQSDNQAIINLSTDNDKYSHIPYWLAWISSRFSATISLR